MANWKAGDRDRRTELPADWKQRRARVLRRDQHTCQLGLDGCTIDATDVDHIGDGGDHDEENLRAVCHPCHLRRTARQGTDARRRIAASRYRPAERHPGLL